MSRPTPFPMGRVASFIAFVGVVGSLLYTSIQSRRAQSDKVARLELENAELRTELAETHEEYEELYSDEPPCCDDYTDLLVDHRALRDLHHEFMQWGPLRTPRDCVRETVLMEWKLPIDQSLWPTDRDAQLAHCIGQLKWEHAGRLQLVKAMDNGNCGSNDRFALPHLGESDVDSLWIYPPGYEPDPDVATH